jgi:hypothetical protein
MTHLRLSGPPKVAYRFLLNFAASYSGGGHKRLHAYAKWFDSRGGAAFAIHPQCASLLEEFPANRYFIVSQTHARRLLDDRSYLTRIVRSLGVPDLYYAYGVPLYRRVGRVNWSHLQNVLLVGRHAVPLSALNRAKFRYLSWRMRRGFAIADVISAESRYSIGALAAAGHPGAFLAVNGSDDELEMLRSPPPARAEEIATLVGTVSYKCLDDSLRVFRMLKEANPGLRLEVIGNASWVPESLRGQPDVLLRGALSRQEVLSRLRRSKFYISTTLAENSYNAAAEGAYLAAQALISEIPAHAELLDGESFERVRVPGVATPMLWVRRNELRALNLKSWDCAISEMIEHAAWCLRASGRSLARGDLALARASDDRNYHQGQEGGHADQISRSRV